MTRKRPRLSRAPSRLLRIPLPPTNGREVWMLINFLSQAVRALRETYPHEIIAFLEHADRHGLVFDPDDLWVDLEIGDETGADNDIPF